MKRLLLLPAAILAALSFAACEEEPAPGPLQPVFSHGVFEFNGKFGTDVMDCFTVTYSLELDGKPIASGEFTDPDECSVKIEEGIDKGRLVFNVDFEPKAGFPELNKNYDLSKSYDCEVMLLDTAGGVLDSGSHNYNSASPEYHTLDDASNLDDFLEVIRDHLAVNFTYFLILPDNTARPVMAIDAGDVLYVDPVYNGSSDPTVCYNPVSDSYYMYYTSRRSNVPGLEGIESVHGSPIGIAESRDGGASWTYIGDCNIDHHPDPGPTYWAPEVICVDGTFHMYLTYVPGIFNDWEHPRDIVHLTSKDGINWTTQSVLDLAVRKVIDACVFQLPDGTWRLWYNNEPDGKSIYYADSKDLYSWEDKGKVTSIVTTGEGPNVTFWKGKYYMVVDEWNGLSVFYSDDATNWTKQEGPYLMNGLNGQRLGNHADIEVVDGHAYMFYFGDLPLKKKYGTGTLVPRRGYAIYLTELQTDGNGLVYCDTNVPCKVKLR